MNLQTSAQSVNFSASLALTRNVYNMEDVVLRHLRTDAEIKRVLHLREGIDLSVHASAPDFAMLEKKETSAAWCSALTYPVKSLERSGSYPWATA